MEGNDDAKFNLFNNLNKCDKKNNIFIINLYNYDKHTNNNISEEDMITTTTEIINEYCKVDNSLAFVFLLKSMNKYDKNSSIVKMLNSNDNIFTEEKSNQIYYDLGYLIAKNIKLFIYSNDISTKFLKSNETISNPNIKYIEMDFLKVNLNNLFSEQKKK